MIKAAFFDIDGTLLSFKTHRMPSSTVRALAALRENGVKTVLSTGRSPLELVDELRHGFDAYIMLNGQLCYDGEGAFRDVPISSEAVGVIIDQVRAGCYDVLVQQRDRSFVNRLSPRVIATGKKVGIEYFEDDIELALEEPVYQFCAFVDPGEEQMFLTETQGLAATRWTDLFCDVVPAGGGKSQGVRAVLDRYGILPEEAVAFGDGENDLSMFAEVGTSVAMGDGLDIVKERATFTTDDVDSDGVWNACVKLGIV